MLIRLLQFPLVILMVYAVIRFTLYRIDRIQAELERLGHPFTFANWLNLSALRREHARHWAGHALARADIQARMDDEGLSFEEAARAVILGEENPCNT